MNIYQMRGKYNLFVNGDKIELKRNKTEYCIRLNNRIHYCGILMQENKQNKDVNENFCLRAQ